MYAGGWITHAHLHMPARRTMIHRQPSYTPVSHSNTPPIINRPAVPQPKVEAVAVNPDSDRHLVFPAPLVILLVAATAVLCIAFLTPHTTPAKPAATVALPAIVSQIRAVDSAELRCMAENIYFEAGGESLAGKMAVGMVVLNRLKNPNYPKTVCGVVHQKNGNTCMFSWLCEDPKPVKESANWQQSKAVAHKLLSQPVEDLTEGSTNFHGMSVNPQWNLKPTVRIDGHQFYR